VSDLPEHLRRAVASSSPGIGYVDLAAALVGGRQRQRSAAMAIYTYQDPDSP